METGDTHRVQLILHYDGSGFHGWQIQPRHRTVQGDIQAALEGLTGGPRTVVGSGRTDTGVHATGQVATVDLPLRWSPDELRGALNATLPRDVWVESARVVAPDFHPRYDAVARRYDYRVGTAGGVGSPFVRGWCWPLGEPLDRALLDEAAGYLVGDHSFALLSKSGQPQRGHRCIVTEAAWTPWEHGMRFAVTANRYLHHMVRYMVGTMVAVAREQRPVSDVPALLARAPGQVTSPPAPAQGLFLTHVEYPDPTRSGPRTGTATQRRTATAS